MNKFKPLVPDTFSNLMPHPLFNGCLEKLVQNVNSPTSARLVIVTGPTGVGKTTLMKAFTSRIAEQCHDEMESNPEMVPFGLYSVKAPGPVPFSWKDCYIQLLRSLQHPFADSPTLARKNGFNCEENESKDISPNLARRIPNDSLFRIVQKTILRRKPKVVVMDEAHHLLRLSSSQSLINQLDHLKYIADETGVLHVLFGTYELLRLMDLSGPLIRRREVVHFSRYIYKSESPEPSIEGFATVLLSYGDALSGIFDFDPLDEVALFYQGSVGCIGILRDWLVRAHCASTSTGRKLITKEILRSTMIASRDRLSLLNESRDGEAYFSDRSCHEEEYLKKLGFSQPIRTDASTIPLKPKRKRRPGVRNPHNDPVGITHLISPSGGSAA